MIPPALTGILKPVAPDNLDDNCSASRDNSASVAEVEMDDEGFKTKNPSPGLISTGSGRIEILCCASAQKMNAIKLKRQRILLIMAN
jgi:hypothetical protein